MKLVWQTTSLETALRNAAGRQLVPGTEPETLPEECAWSASDTAVFADGCAIVVESRLGRGVPDLDAPRVWWGYPVPAPTGEPADGQ